MAITSIVHKHSGAHQFRGVFDSVVEYEAVLDAPNILSNGFHTESIAIPGAQFGDMCLVSVVGDVQNLNVEAHVEAADTVSLHIKNNTAGAIDLPSTDIHLILLRPYHSH